MLNKQDILDFVSDNDLGRSESSQLFSFSQPIDENEYFILTKKMLSTNDF